MNFITRDSFDTAKLIHNLVIFPLKTNYDESSTLVETLRIDWPEVFGKGRKFYMQYCSIISPGVAKDEDAWHYHNNQEDRIIVASGAIIFVVGDNRKRSPTKGSTNFLYMTSKTPYMLIVPKKVLHAFLVVSREKALILNFPTALYDPKDNMSIPFTETNGLFADSMLFSWKKIKKDLDAYNKNS